MTADKKIFIAAILSSVYFVLMFTGVFAGINSVVIGAVAELVTIPLMLFQVFILGFIGYNLLKREKPLTYRFALSAIMSAGLVLCFFFVK
ncbi:hypothetical protein H9X96_15150 [Pedobacter sp. N36a]|uniref:hypothetical protein n=1 Tax=Pedobacter sp. N36a TaxID=2767996 RepID=UPI0016575B21|nr:hypothetical protein [Pedobacter sp. N36a]MBC8987109.1 hypothetical protein [Pedobacter sp. N36a]